MCNLLDDSCYSGKGSQYGCGDIDGAKVVQFLYGYDFEDRVL